MFGKRITASGYPDRPVRGRAFPIAMAVIGGLAAIQVAAIVVGLMGRGSVVSLPPAAPAPPAPAAPEFTTAPPEFAAAPPLEREAPAPVLPVAPQLELPSAVSSPSLGAAPVEESPAMPFVGPADASTPSLGAGRSASLFEALAGAARTRPLPDPILERLLAAGAEHRGKGNAPGALKNFREVESALPDEPRVLAEIAATLGRMGLEEKAAGYWERVEGLGEIGAGAYFPIARSELRGEEAPKVADSPDAREAVAMAETPAVAEGPSKKMKVGEVKVLEQAPTSEGQKVSLSVVVDADPATQPVADDLFLAVQFFDRLGDGTVKPSTADTSYLYPTEPYDWLVDGTETIVVNYIQPVFSEEERLNHGERVYHGYAIRLYYRDELQDEVFVPAVLKTMAPEITPSFAPPAQTVGPANSLFPGSPAP